MASSPWLEIIVITAYASIDTAVEAIKRGATDYIPKPTEMKRGRPKTACLFVARNRVLGSGLLT
jgi:DNA-binding NtrC family response regulator